MINRVVWEKTIVKAKIGVLVQTGTLLVFGLKQDKSNCFISSYVCSCSCFSSWLHFEHDG